MYDSPLSSDVKNALSVETEKTTPFPSLTIDIDFPMIEQEQEIPPPSGCKGFVQSHPYATFFLTLGVGGVATGIYLLASANSYEEGKMGRAVLAVSIFSLWVLVISCK